MKWSFACFAPIQFYYHYQHMPIFLFLLIHNEKLMHLCTHTFTMLIQVCAYMHLQLAYGCYYLIFIHSYCMHFCGAPLPKHMQYQTFLLCKSKEWLLLDQKFILFTSYFASLWLYTKKKSFDMAFDPYKLNGKIVNFCQSF